MTVIEKIETIDNKIEGNKAQYNKMLRFQLYHQATLVNINFRHVNILLVKDLL